MNGHSNGNSISTIYQNGNHNGNYHKGSNGVHEVSNLDVRSYKANEVLPEVDIVVVGSGLSGAVLAERYASQLNKKVLVLEKRDHIGGNCYDYLDDNGILVNKYGAHLFHTNIERVWKYVTSHAEWKRWEHQVLAYVDGQFVSVPANITTVNRLCDEHIQTSDEMVQWLKKEQVHCLDPQNSKDVALSRVGPRLYELLFRPYTIKQWNKDPSELAPSVLARIPVHANYDTRYFIDKFQALPVNGYTSIFRKILDHPNITVKVNCDFFKVKSELQGHEKLFFTGPIDQYFAGAGLPNLEYRSLRFEKIDYKNVNFFQPNSVVNYPSTNYPFTRIVEYKHFLHQQSPHTTIVKEYSSEKGEPYYPVPNEQNMALYASYQALAEAEEKENNVYFVGRLANYKYYNMDQAIDNALNWFEKLENISYP